MTPRATIQIDQARECLNQERTRTQAEEHAFQQFVSRVDDIEVDDSRSSGWSQHRGSVRSPIGMDSNGKQPSQIEDAYRETVLDTDHYATEYDDSSIYESVAAELTPEIAQSLKHNDRLTSELRTAVLEVAKQRRNDRTTFLEVLDHEATSVTEAREEIRTIETAISELADPPFEAWNFTALTTARNQLLALENDCDAVAHQRQQFLDERGSLRAIHPEESLNDYLYDPLDWTYPVLSAITTCVGRIQRICRWIEQALTQK
jgi:small-conductance mechanosensitive channel